MLSRVTTAIRKISVRPARSTARAISLGVFRRSAPSTIAIIRSRKVEPAAEVIRTLSQSETTVVPPVTADRSPPLSRMTGALSPVIAASLTEAMPSTISPSEGTTSPASTRTIWPTRSSLAGVGTTVPLSPTSLAFVVTRVARRLSAAAFPRPSATLSAKLANSTVAQSQSAICRANPQAPWSFMARAVEAVARMATISVAKITGLPVSLRGSSLTKAARVARPRIAPEKLPESVVALRRFSPSGAVAKVMCVALWGFSGPRSRGALGSARRSDQGRERGRIAGRP